MDNKTIEIHVFGRVQGVYFRQSAANIAESLRITGYAENLQDGSVRIVAQGKESSLEELLRWSQRGSLLAKVEGMSYKWLETEDVFKNFEVKRSGSLIKDQVKSFLHLGKRIQKKLLPLSSDIRIPNHVVIIPDGNRRWAKERGMKPWQAYWYVSERIGEVFAAAKEFSVKHLTLWGLSTENWKRDNEELEQIMKVLNKVLDNYSSAFHKEKIRFRHLGRKDRLPKELIDRLVELEESTKGYTERSVNLALDYGGRDEILRAINGFIKSGKSEVTEQDFSEFLDTNGLPDPDLIIRTSGEKRLSGMMPWQTVYSEFYFTNVYFPDFGIENFREAILEYSSRKRNFGGDADKEKQKKQVQEVSGDIALNVA